MGVEVMLKLWATSVGWRDKSVLNGWALVSRTSWCHSLAVVTSGQSGERG